MLLPVNRCVLRRDLYRSKLWREWRGNGKLFHTKYAVWLESFLPNLDDDVGNANKF